MNLLHILLYQLWKIIPDYFFLEQIIPDYWYSLLDFLF